MTEAPSSEKKPIGTQKPAPPVFRAGSSTARLKPAEIKPLLTSEQTRSEPVAQGLDLADRPKIILTAGRGKTGKTTFLRWIVEMAQRDGKAPLLADIDPTNATFSTYFGGVARPDTFNQAAVRDWLQDFMEFAIAEQQTAIIDLGVAIRSCAP
ncbi:hypothetical protein AA11237_3262 [Acidocella aminolytica 101 = DSM 11237]|uniref:hypothetical protein n=1 Tax=Acidocella aminolytica TaxID=33998 RepID=UPI002156844B|nr:hypothetical protein [Acidocella aminolytica]GBQ43361.1 hypothetical protein AA11237_3262 [Acidocella aminolytica 101 = DSM 11237]